MVDVLAGEPASTSTLTLRAPTRHAAATHSQTRSAGVMPVLLVPGLATPPAMFTDLAAMRSLLRRASRERRYLPPPSYLPSLPRVGMA